MINFIAGLALGAVIGVTIMAVASANAYDKGWEDAYDTFKAFYKRSTEI